MIKKLLFFFCAILFSLSAWSQNFHRNSATLNVFSYREPFYLIIDGVKFNDKPTNKIRVESMPKKSFNIQVELPSSLGKRSSLSPVYFYNELNEALEVTLLANFDRFGHNDLMMYAFHPISRSIPDLNSFVVFDYNNPHVKPYLGQGTDPFGRYKQMPTKDFSIFLENLKKQSFDNDKMRIVPLATVDYMFSIDQIEQAMKVFSWDDGKIKFAEFMYPKCLERGSYLKLLSNLTFSSSQNQLRDFIKNESSLSYSIQRMSTSGFEDFMKGLKKQSFDQDKLDYIAAISSSTSFSVAQIKAILKTFSFDDRRLDAAKILMENCSDKQLYYTLEDVFTFYSSKEAFLNFIKR